MKEIKETIINLYSQLDKLTNLDKSTVNMTQKALKEIERISNSPADVLLAEDKDYLIMMLDERIKYAANILMKMPDTNLTKGKIKDDLERFCVIKNKLSK